MPRRPDETPEEYKERILDPISPTFCGAKWYGATIMLGSGMTKSCHHPSEHKIPVREVQFDHRALHNTRHKMVQRKKMLEGKRPDECSYCWRLEDMQSDGVVGDRVFYTSFFEDDDLNAIKDIPWNEQIEVQKLEISFDRICNFACSYCNPTFSTTWGKDIKKNGGYVNLKTNNGQNPYQRDGSWAEPYGKLNKDNPYVEAFWKWWPSLSQNLTQLRVTGGEPTMSPHFWKLADRIKEDGINPNMQFSVNTNLGMKADILDRLIDFTHHVKRFTVFTSCEAHGSHAEYIRDGLNYNDWLANLWRLVGEGNVEMANIMMAINAPCLFSITDMWDDLLVMKRKKGWRFPFFSVNMVHYPSFMSPLVLPQHLRDECRENISGWLENQKNSGMLWDTEQYNVQKLISYLEKGDDGDQDSEAKENDFYWFYKQYDHRRGKNFVKTFAGPLAEWYQELEKKYG
jgi:hypothetical protein